MEKLNCWEFKKCGRESGGNNVPELGVCPASTNTLLDGIHGGISAGRSCWVVAGTMCKGEIHGTFAQKYKDCGTCDFYGLVRDEEREGFLMSVDILNMIKEQ
ncbi:MAG: two-CW domain-containing protein [Nitrospirota bacterium]